MVTFLLMLSLRICYVVRAYMPLKNTPSIYHVDQALEAAPRIVEVILMGYLNVRLKEPGNKRKEDLETALVDRRLVNMTAQFIPQSQFIRGGHWT